MGSVTLAGGDTDRLVGKVLERRFRVDRLLGRGGMGDVYVAEDVHLRRRCAIKALSSGLLGLRANVERFLREARAIARLDHENIVEVYSLGEDPTGIVFFAMELLEGEDLEARLRRRAQHPVHWRDCCEWGVQIARGMAAVHDAGLIHRDLKPSNVFLARQRDGGEKIKLLDFGIACPDTGSGLTQTGTVLGTPFYMAPEQLRPGPIDRRCDIYSLGVLLYRALTDRLPFHGDPLQVALQHCDVDPPRFRVAAPGLRSPARLEAVVRTALAKRPADRYQDMHALQRALEQVLAAPDDARPPVAAARPRHRVRRVLAGCGLLGAVALCPFVELADAPLSPAPAAALRTARDAPATPIVERPTAPAPATPPPADPIATATAVLAPASAPTRRRSRPPGPRGDDVASAQDRLRRQAQACRRRLNAPPTPLLTIDYAVASDGSVTRATAKVSGALGRCLADAVRRARFAPGLALGQRIDL